MLLEYGASINIRNRAGNYPVAWAARHNDTSILQMILDKGATVNDADDKGFTALHICAFANSVPACEILLDKGADVNAANEKGYTPIFTAAEMHNTEVALVLMDRGADMTLEDENENGPVDLCSGRAATQKYEGLPHQVKLLETMREKGGLSYLKRAFLSAGFSEETAGALSCRVSGATGGVAASMLTTGLDPSLTMRGAQPGGGDCECRNPAIF